MDETKVTAQPRGFPQEGPSYRTVLGWGTAVQGGRVWKGEPALDQPKKDREGPFSGSRDRGCCLGPAAWPGQPLEGLGVEALLAWQGLVPKVPSPSCPGEVRVMAQGQFVCFENVVWWARITAVW